jgi:hypothetical protein
MKHSLLALAVLAFSTLANAQRPVTKSPAKSNSAHSSHDTLRHDSIRHESPKPGALKPYAEVITPKAVTSYGLFKVHKVDDKWYFEIPDSLLGREILVVNRIARAATGGRAQMLGYAGDEINENTIAFNKGPNDKLFLSNISYTEISRDTSADGMFRAVRNSNLQPIAAAFDIKAVSKDSSSTVIDVTDYLNGDNDILFFDPGIKKTLGLTALAADRSYVEGIRSFPANIEIRTLKTYTKSSMTPFGPTPPVPATYELNSSLVLLPKIPMQPRYYDDRIGYFATAYTDFDANPQGVEQTAMITRWRLEPKDKAAYLRGELTEPVKPILFYIDPATPKKWVPYLIQGVNDWNAAFEQAGFKNAILAKEAPLTDSAWDIDDATHNAIVYKPSPIPNASGPHVHDPRSGEIIETHINWYHNVMQALHDWFLVQAAAVDPRARHPELDDALMGQLIRFVVSHEVGHTLGLRHNFGASSTVPVDSLRSNHFLSLHGHTPSIMDYARFDYVAQPQDHIDEANLFPRIGDYDKWAIEWGYKWFPDQERREAERVRLNQWVIKEITANPRLWFGTEADRDDPRCQNEDLGDDAMKAGAYGIKNLQRILPNLPAWTQEPAKGYDGLKEMYGQLADQFGRYMGHAVKNIGGIMTTPRTAEEKGSVVTFVPKGRQQEAMRFLQAQLFSTPVWLLDKKIFALTGAGANTLLSLQSATLAAILNDGTLGKLILFQTQDPAHAYTPAAMLGDLQRGIWSELAGRGPITIYRRNLQKFYTERLIALINPPALPAGLTLLSRVDDQQSVVRANARQLLTRIRAALPGTSDSDTRAHLQDCAQRLDNALNPKKS